MLIKTGKNVRDLFHKTREEYVDIPVNVTNFLNISTDRDSQEIFYPRASGLYKECIRMTTLGYMNQKRITRYVPMKQRITFGKGNAYHWWCQNTPDLFGGNRVGFWKCLACGTVRYFGHPPKTPCQNCGASVEATFYHEHLMVAEWDYFLTGHPDMFLSQNNKIYVAEIKSIQYKDFAVLQDALIEHKWQILAYMMGLSHDKTVPAKIESDRGYVVYISKAEAKKEFPVKIFEVVPDEYIQGQICDRLKLFADGIVDFPKSLPPTSQKCLNAGWDSYMSRQCPVINDCIKYYREFGNGE